MEASYINDIHTCKIVFAAANSKGLWDVSLQIE